MQSGASLCSRRFHYLFCSVSGPRVGFCVPSPELLTWWNSRPFSKHLSSELDVIPLQVPVQICDSLISTSCLELSARNHLPVAIFSIENSLFFHIYSCVSNRVCVTHVQVIQNIRPQSHNFQICYQNENGVLKMSCCPSSPLPRCCAK